MLFVVQSQSCLALCDPMDCVACQAPLFLGFASQEYWSGSPFLFSGYLPNPGIEFVSPALDHLVAQVNCMGRLKEDKNGIILTKSGLYKSLLVSTSPS